jgi:diaminohydroxyphosphoribosylaminopyrimidine deaminase / 5-amino-6-(5-phosphoribosylamino)uracil reductase
VNHIHYMHHALSLSRRNLGQAWPNPAVGAVVMKDNQIIGEGYTGKGGRPHAETEALKNIDARGATLYVTLEPCSHHGKTPPCTDAIIAARIAACVIACRDPNPLVNGQGIAKLKAAGIDVIEGVCEAEAKQSHEGFFSLIEKKRPFVALKIATSQDRKITTGDPKNQWITGEAARDYGHLLRSEYDAILTGIGTVLADDPRLTCRLPGREDRSPVRVILDRKHRLPAESQIAKTSDTIPTWILDLPDIPAVLAYLAERGITRVLVEAGRKLTENFLESGFVDRIYWFRAPVVIGDKGLAIRDLAAISGYKKVESKPLAADTLDIWELCSPES